MLVRYKKALEKIAMGLLSFMPQEKDVRRLMETIQQYEQLDNWMLYLWKEDEEYVGIIGVRTEDTVATIQHITVIPSYRGEGVALEMLQQLRDLNLFTEIKPNDETEPFVQKCMPILEEG
ncbi:GNAT family N-acetyltransferase [Lysinibacillus odysseyi]|uniref:Acetyltransferase n=1 Tax=Lysinibacillus odysseyi 34hs-1 = NBRC 100172 TaxID=1220589 RepID=A0A0A3IN39_9BACI|nr:GNAT family N-acetyltransferase [Lysinibacillus odysseyi]KGR84865.1 acetyltransferase [Lysinibacillus odysseyi 34hs-1 = NBRC 100172]